jgi:hypothetical protein
VSKSMPSNGRVQVGASQLLLRARPLAIRLLLATYYCRSVQATFRSEAPGWLHTLSDHFSAVLGRLFNTNFS